MAEAYVMGMLTANIDGAIQKVAELESCTLDITSDLHTRKVSDQRKPAEIVATSLKFAISAKRAYIDSGITRAMLEGKKLSCVLYGKKPSEEKKAIPLRDVRGLVLNKVNMGDFDGTKHVTEDFGGEAADVIILD